MALAPGTHTVGPGNGTMQVRTYREGVAQKVGHDLIIEVERWKATVAVEEDGRPSSVALEADATSLQVREGLRGVKPLSDRDRASIRKEIDAKILLREPIAFRSRAVELGDGRLTAEGELSLAGATRPARFELDVAADGSVTGTLPVTQTEWNIKPYRGFMGALKVRDSVDVVLDVRLPSA
jgi:polyisoprenoid-binding protein YceI